jgi:hypothetical protein
MSQLRDYIQKHPSSAQRLVGLDYAQLMELIGQAERLHNQKKLADEQKKTRIIKAGGGRQPKLSLSDQVLLTLVYLHHTNFLKLCYRYSCQNKFPSRQRSNDFFSQFF